jgi:hypothetical protein
MTAPPLPGSDETGKGAVVPTMRASTSRRSSSAHQRRTVDIEKETPAEENEQVERPAAEDTASPPAFEDDQPPG